MLTIIRVILCILFSILYIILTLLAVACGVLPMPKSGADDPFLTSLWRWADHLKLNNHQGKYAKPNN